MEPIIIRVDFIELYEEILIAKRAIKSIKKEERDESYQNRFGLSFAISDNKEDDYVVYFEFRTNRDYFFKKIGDIDIKCTN